MAPILVFFCGGAMYMPFIVVAQMFDWLALRKPRSFPIQTGHDSKGTYLQPLKQTAAASLIYPLP